MKVIRYLVGVLFSLIILLVLVGLILPSTIRLERTTVIDAPLDTVFDYVNDLRKNELWSSWKKRDPSSEWTYTQNTVGVGASYHWKGKKSGEGSLTIIESTPGRLVRTALDFGQMGKAFAGHRFESVSEGIKVTQFFEQGVGMNLPGRYFGLFAEGMIGKDFDKSLGNLKDLAEGGKNGK